MDPITAIATALVAGAAAEAQNIGGDLLKASYSALKSLIDELLQKSGAKAAPLLAPCSEAQTEVLKEALSNAKVGDHPQVIKAAEALRQQLAALPPADQQRIGVEIRLLTADTLVFYTVEPPSTGTGTLIDEAHTKTATFGTPAHPN